MIRIRVNMVAAALGMLVVVGVVAVFLSLGSQRPQRSGRHPVVRRQGPLVIRNFSPGKAPALPGRTVCTGELTPRALGPGGLFYMTTCLFQSPGIGGSPHGKFQASSRKLDGVNQYRFLITASGLRPNADKSVYAVWLLQAAPRGGTVGTYRLLAPQRPRLLGVIEPGVGPDGKLAAEGTVPE
jgi:hypothetical protein